MRAAVGSGRLGPGAPLPASRALAADLLVSRNTITAAYDQLAAEGYLEHFERRGVYVAAVLPDVLQRACAPEARLPGPPPRGRLSPAGEVYVAAARRLAEPPGPRLTSLEEPIPFRAGDPALDAFPVRRWLRVLSRRWRIGSVPLGYASPAGVRPLREAIAGYVGSSRGVVCDADQVFVVSGTQQALDLAARLVLGRGDSAWFEDPGYPGGRAAIAGAGGVVVPVPVDEAGLEVAAGIAMAPEARLAYVTPSHQYPTGAVMSLERRGALLRWATAADAWVLEDDYDSEFRYASRPLPALQGLDAGGRVIYTGTFSKTLFPALRLAYVVAPPALVEAFNAACVLGGRHAPTDAQLATADFIAAGEFDRHLRRMRALYAERQAALLEALAATGLEELLDVSAAAAGLHLVAWLRAPGADAAAAVRSAAAAGVEVAALSQYSARGLERDALVLGYGAFSPARLRAGAQTLARALRG